MIPDLLREFRYAFRRIAKDKAQTATIVATLALTIGANTAIYSAVHGILIRPLPYPEPERLVRVHTSRYHPLEDREYGDESSIPDFRDWKGNTATFAAMEGIRHIWLVDDSESPADVSAVRVTPGFLALVGARAQSGRLLASMDLRPGAPPVAVLTHAYWMSRYGGDDRVVGQSIRLGEPRAESDGGVFRYPIDYAVYTVIGVAAPLSGPLTEDLEVFVPWNMETDPLRENRNTFHLPIVGQLRPGVSVEEAQAELDRIRADLNREQSGAGVSAPLVESLHDRTVAEVRPALLVLQGATALLLLIAVTNVANVLLLRGSSRKSQLLVDAALGANRWRLAGGHVAESIILSVAGALAGLGVAHVCLRTLRAVSPGWIPRLDEVALDGAVLSVTFLVAAGCGLLLALAPMVGLRRNLMWKGGSVATAGGARHRRLLNGLVVAQVTLSFVLLVGTGLMLRSFVALRGVPIGIDPRQVVTFSFGPGSITAGPSGPARSRMLQQYREASEHLAEIPDVRGVTLTSQAPLEGSAVAVSVEILTGLRQGETTSPVELVAVAENFFEFVGSQVVAGRLFLESDAARASDVVVVDSELARVMWPAESPLGQRVRIYGQDSEVIGVVEPIRYAGLEDELRPKLYHPLERAGGGAFGTTGLVRHDGGAQAMISRIEARLATLGDDVAPVDPRPLEAVYDEYLSEPRFYVWLSTALGLLALTVAGVGVYGVTASVVAERKNEFALRMALGGAWFQIVRSFYRRHAVLLVLGLGLGLLGAAWLTRYLRGLLFEIQPADSTAWIATAIVLSLATLVAASIPLTRALRVDPAAHLHRE